MTLPGIKSIHGAGEDWLAGKHVSLDSIPLPFFFSSEMNPYWKRNHPFAACELHGKWMPVETSRGCPNACGFCTVSDLWGKWEGRDLDRLEAYFHQYLHYLRVETIIILDDNIMARIEHFLGVCELLKKYGFYWTLSNGAFNRHLLRHDVLEALKNSRCLFMSLPFEAGNERSASLMNLGKKYLRFEEAESVALSLRSLGIHTAGQFIIGYPGETEDDVKATLAYANALPLDERHIHIAMPLPGTSM